MSGQDYKMDGFDENVSPAFLKDDVRKLQSKNRTLTFCTAFAVFLAFVGFVLAAFAARFVDQNGSALERAHLGDGSVVLRLGQSSLSGYSSAYSLFRGSGSWTNKPELATRTSDFQAVTVGDKIYLIGGQDDSGNALNTLIEYDVIRETYTTKTNMPGTRLRFAAVAHDGKIYVIGGLSADDCSDMLHTTLVYTISADSWTTGPSLEIGRSDTCAAVVDGKIYVVGGYDTVNCAWSGDDALSSVEMLDTSATTPRWTSAPARPAKRGDVTCASSGGSVYAIGGYYEPNWNGTLGFKDTVFALDVSSGASAWVTKSPMPGARGDKAAATLSDGSIVVVGGETFADEYTTQIAMHTVEQYYPKHDTWVAKAPIPTARFRFAAAAHNDFVHAFGGHEICTTTYDANGNFVSSDCATTANTLNSHEVLMDVTHPDVWVHVK
jgi:N-acetylneuraminic acid mutarotase